MSTIIIVWNCRDDYFGTYRSQDGQYKLMVIKETNQDIEGEIINLIQSLQLKEENFLLFLHKSDNLPNILANTFPQEKEYNDNYKCKYFYFGGLEGVLYQYILYGKTKLQSEIYDNVADKKLTEKGIVAFHKTWDTYDKEGNLQSSGAENPMHHLHRLIDYWENIVNLARTEYMKENETAVDRSKILLEFDATKRRWQAYQKSENSNDEYKYLQIKKLNAYYQQFGKEGDSGKIYTEARTILNALKNLTKQVQKILIIDDEFGIVEESRMRFLNVHKLYDATSEFLEDNDTFQSEIRTMPANKQDLETNINAVFFSFLRKENDNYELLTEDALIEEVKRLKKVIKEKEYSVIFLDVRFYLKNINKINYDDNNDYTLEREHYGFQILSEMLRQELQKEIAIVLMSYDYFTFEMTKFAEYPINTKDVERYVRFYDKMLPIAEYVSRYTYVSVEEIKDARAKTISLERIGNTIDTLFKEEKQNQFLNKEEIPYFFLYEIRKQERLHHCLQLRVVKKEVWEELEAKSQTERSKLNDLAAAIVENYSTAFFIEKAHIYAEKQKWFGENIALSQILKMLWEYTPNKRNKQEWEGMYGEIIEVFIFLLRNITKEAHIFENENKSAAMRLLGGEMFKNTDKQKLIDLFDRMTNVPIRQEDANSSKSSISQILNFFGLSSDNLKKLKDYPEFKEIKDKEDKRGSKKTLKS